MLGRRYKFSKNTKMAVKKAMVINWYYILALILFFFFHDTMTYLTIDPRRMALHFSLALEYSNMDILISLHFSYAFEFKINFHKGGQLF